MSQVLVSEWSFLRLALPVFGGATIGLFVSLVLYGAKPVLIYVVFAGLLVVLPSLFIKDVKLYWMTVFLLALQFDFKKNLVDGLEVLDALKIDTMQFVFTPEIRLSDLALLMLLGVWAHKVGFEGKLFDVPKRAWLAFGFLGWAILSAVKAPHLYLSVVELVRQSKFILIYLYAANNVDSKRTLKLIGIVLIPSFVLQAGVTFGRYEFRYFEPLESLLGVDSHVDPKLREELLTVDSQAQEGFGFTEAKRSFGTLPSPASTTKFCLLVMPLALMFSLKNPVVSSRWMFAAAAVSGLATFYFSFSRTSMIACLAEMALFCWYALRRGYIQKHVAIYILGIIIVAGMFGTPKLWTFMNNRSDAVTVRFLQYEVTTNMILSNPILGVGINNSSGVKKDLTQDSAFVLDPLRRSGEQPIHSLYLTVMAETGLIGFALYMGFFVMTYKDATALSQRGRHPEIRFYSTILLLCFAGLAVGVLTDPLWEDPIQTLLWFYAGAVVALQKMDAEPIGQNA
jgi:O-antigen ligase